MWRFHFILSCAPFFFADQVLGAAFSVSTTDFDDWLGASRFSLVAFHAPWCAHSRSLLPEFDAAADEFTPKVRDFMARNGADIKFGKVDVVSEEDLYWRYDIQSSPTVLLFRDSVLVTECPERTHEGLRNWIKKYIEYKPLMLPDTTAVNNFEHARFFDENVPGEGETELDGVVLAVGFLPSLASGDYVGEAFITAALSMSQNLPVAVTLDALAAQAYNVTPPALLMIKPAGFNTDRYSILSPLPGGAGGVEKIRRFISYHRFPSVIDWSPYTAPRYIFATRPGYERHLIAFVSKKEEPALAAHLRVTLEAVSEELHGRAICIVSDDARNRDASYIRHKTQTEDVVNAVRLVVSNHREGTLDVFRPKESEMSKMTDKVILEFFEDVMSGALAPLGASDDFVKEVGKSSGNDEL